MEHLFYAYFCSVLFFIITEERWNEKKENTKAMPEVVYTVEEYAENPQVLGVSEDIIRTAFAKAGIREATQSTAKKLVDTFRKKEV